jgi:CRP-like cAMP-binding protein
MERRHLSKFLYNFNMKKLEQGSYIARQGEPFDKVVLVYSGEIQISRMGWMEVPDKGERTE